MVDKMVGGGSSVVPIGSKDGSEVTDVESIGGSDVVVSIGSEVVGLVLGDSDVLIRLHGPKPRIVKEGSLHFFCAK